IGISYLSEDSPFARNSREHSPDFSDPHWRQCPPNYSRGCRSGDSVSGKLSERSRRSADWSYSSRRGPCARNPRRDDSQQPFAQDDLVNAVISSSRSSLCIRLFQNSPCPHSASQWFSIPCSAKEL